MKYIFAKNSTNYADFAGGRVLYSMKGATGFPVRLASEIFQRCTDFLIKQGSRGPYTIYDPFCGSGYLLTVLGFLHGKSIKKIIASDIDVKFINMAKKNLELIESIKEITLKFEDLKLIKVEGHSGVEGNERADLLATSAIKEGNKP